MHGLGYIVRSNARAAARGGRYEAQVLDAAKVEIERLKGELAIALAVSCRMQSEAEDAKARVEELEAQLKEQSK